MLSNDVAKSAALKASLSEVNIHLTRALEVLEDVPDGADSPRRWGRGQRTGEGRGLQARLQLPRDLWKRS